MGRSEAETEGGRVGRSEGELEGGELEGGWEMEGKRVKWGERRVRRKKSKQ